MSTRNRVPKIGETVGADGQKGTFTIIAVHRDPNIVNLRLIGPRDFTIEVPWGVLVYQPSEDVNQAAARTIREATERD